MAHYKTRSGLPVIIHDFEGKGTFSWKGTIYKPHKGGKGRNIYQIWQPGGRNTIIRDHGWDLQEVSKQEWDTLFHVKETA